MCEHSFYEERNNKPQIYCKLNNQICLFSKFCVNQNKYIHREGFENCHMKNSFENKKEIPSGAYYVRFVKKGFAYVELTNDKIVKIKDTIGNIENYVYVKQEDGEYQISLTPFEETPKKTTKTTRKKK